MLGKKVAVTGKIRAMRQKDWPTLTLDDGEGGHPACTTPPLGQAKSVRVPIHVDISGRSRGAVHPGILEGRII
ncbi:hypothetical protein D3C72_1648480 [compost metagenome]